jgi:hypothetical protein
VSVPLAPYLTWRELREQLAGQDCEFEAATLRDERGYLVAITWIRRPIDEGMTKLRVYSVTYADDDRVEPSIVKSLCAALGIHPKTLGFSFGSDLG